MIELAMLSLRNAGLYFLYYMKRIVSFFIFLSVFSFIFQMPGSALSVKKAYADDNYFASAAKFSADLIAEVSAFNLLLTSCNSLPGLDAATMPAPAL